MTSKKGPDRRQQSATYLQNLLEKGVKSEVRALFAFDEDSTEDEIVFLFNLWGRHFYPKFFKVSDAPFHTDIDHNIVRVYLGLQSSFVDIAFRGGAKTTRTKLFTAYAISNDVSHRRRFIKVLSADIDNAEQIVTDVYNLLIRPVITYYYPEIFQKTNEKRKETMATFTTATGVKMLSDSVGTDQRGDIQEEARPDYIWFDDFETRKTLRSLVVTQAIWDNMEEAKNGLARGGGCLYNCNYLSERGNVHRLVKKYPEHTLVTPIRNKAGDPTWPAAYTREAIATIERDAEDFAGEYLCEPAAGHDIFFDRASLERQVAQPVVREVADFKMFYKFDASHRYGAGHDVAGGVGLDSSTSVFIDFSTVPNRVVATFHSNTIGPEIFGDEIKRQAEYYGEPIVAPENNKFDMVIGRLRQIYKRIYFTEMDETRVGLPPRVRYYGWNTNAMTKPKALFDLKKALESGFLELSDPDLIAEAKSFTRDDLMDRQADPRLVTRHFDLLMALAIAWQMKDYAEVKRDEEGTYQQPSFERPGLE